MIDKGNRYTINLKRFFFCNGLPWHGFDLGSKDLTAASISAGGNATFPLPLIETELLQVENRAAAANQD